MHDPIAAGRRSALRAVAMQAIVAALVAAAFLVQGPRPALAAAGGGAALVAGNALAALLALGGGIQPAGAALARLLLGAMGKWLVVVAMLTIVLGVWRLPPFPALAGLVVGLLAHSLALNFLASNRKRRGTSVER
ncbi:MAG: hypothetical protein ABIO58_07140 [Luteimonas sp.]